MAEPALLEELLRRLQEAGGGGADSGELAARLGIDHQLVVGAVKSLQTLGD
ncbi:hypothetical protein chiPu_0031893, partial [Chiloscyllium punctatum]|nr:hypothetical protein [Chiloscyllium punctatum]